MGARVLKPLLLDTHSAAEQLGVSYDWLKKRAAARTVPCTRLGRSVRFSAENLEAIVRAGETRPYPPGQPYMVAEPPPTRRRRSRVAQR